MILLKGGNTGGIRRGRDAAKLSLVVSKALCQQLACEGSGATVCCITKSVWTIRELITA